MEKPCFLILGNQLFPRSFINDFKETHRFVMIESYELCTYVKHHKQKLLLFIGAMRQYAKELEEAGFELEYHQLVFLNSSIEKPSKADIEEEKEQDFTDLLARSIYGSKKIKCFEIEDKFFEKKIQSFCRENKIELEIEESPMFLNSRKYFEDYLSSVKRPFMANFYERQRKEHGILLTEDGKPVGGKWSYDSENRKKLPKDFQLEYKQPEWSYPDWFLDLKEQINNSFPEHPGSLDDFCFPVTRRGYLKLLREFLKDALRDFGKYQDALSEEHNFLYHSLLSPGINLGLITPEEVLQYTLDHYKNNDQEIPLSSVEGFIRQIIGWREFVRGIYQNYSERQDEENFFQHKRKLGEAWYTGQTGIPAVDDSIKKANQFAYCHHIERLMILSNLMLLSEVEPKEVYRWFMEMFIDSSDWVMGPNVYGMGQFSDGGIFATKPYIAGSNYILKMSHYSKGEWCDIMDGLYWRFIENKKDFFKKNPRMKMMLGMLEKLDADKKKRIYKAADQFLENQSIFK